MLQCSTVWLSKILRISIAPHCWGGHQLLNKFKQVMSCVQGRFTEPHPSVTRPSPWKDLRSLGVQNLQLGHSATIFYLARFRNQGLLQVLQLLKIHLNPVLVLVQFKEHHPQLPHASTFCKAMPRNCLKCHAIVALTWVRSQTQRIWTLSSK